jgi:hypothetical protein
MELRKYLPIVTSLFIPFLGYASGNDVIPFVGLQLLLVVCFIIFILALKLSLKSKLILCLIFAVSYTTVLYLISTIPYSENLIWINSISIGVPILCVFTSYIIIRSRLGKN